MDMKYIDELMWEIKKCRDELHDAHLEYDIADEDMVDYVTVPFHFYNGHHLPIVELKRNGETLLTFEEGRQNLFDWLNKRFM